MLEQSLHWMGLGLCHQIPERSLFGGGVQAPVCARDTGIYVGFTLAMIVIAFLHRGERPRGFPRGHVWAVMVVLLAWMGWDGVSSYVGLRETTNTLRVLTGLGVGFSIAAVLVPMLNDEVWLSAGSGRLLEPAWRFWVWLAAIPLSWGLIAFGGPLLGVAFPVLIAVSILVTLTTINLVIVAMLPFFDRQARRWWDLLGPIAVALALSFAEIAAAGWLRLYLDRLAAGLAS